MAEEKSDAGFKVVDRRSFGGDGDSREKGEETAAAASSAAGAAADSTRSTATASTPELNTEPGGDGDFGFEDGALPEAGFETLVSFLGTTAMFQLGLVTGPSGERIPADLTNARHTVDMLEVLEQKTRGNLTSDEARLLEDVLYELRMTFVEVQRRAAARPK